MKKIKNDNNDNDNNDHIKTETITEIKLSITCRLQYCYWDGGLQKKEMTGDRQPNW